MSFIIGSAIVAMLVTIGVAWAVVRRRPQASEGKQVRWAALSFPLLSVLLFVGAVVATLLSSDGTRVQENAAGMVIFAFVFFLVYALVIGAVVGVPTAVIAVRRFRAH